jgi:arylsulfatase A-like enzyme
MYRLFFLFFMILQFTACDRTDITSEGEAKQPNIIILFADDMGYGDLGCYGHPLIRTPHLDQMSKEGIRLTSFYVAESLCTPSRAALLTGRYPFRSGMHFVLGPESTNGLPASEFTMAEGLKSKGYRTAIFGKWHLGHQKEFLPTRHGFDTYFGIPYSNDMQKPWVQTDVPLSLWENESPIEHPVDQDYLTERYTERALTFIRENKDQPFFLYLPYNMPHMPVHASPKFRGKSRGGLYGDVIEMIDWSAGQILKELNDLGLAENTFVVFTSDNGPWSSIPERMVANGNERHHAGTAGLLEGRKATPYEGGHRVPAIIRFPGIIPAGRVAADMATTMDLYMTVMDLAGISMPEDMTFDGQTLLPFLKGESSAPTHTFYYILGKKLCAIRNGPWKLMINNKGSREIETSELDSVTLFHLEWDPGERYDFSDKHPEVVEELKQMLVKFDKEMSGYMD